MDSKDTYSKSVQEQKDLARTNADLMKNIVQGKNRSLEHSEKWMSVNINDIVNQFAPGAQAEVQGNKVEWRDKEGKVSIVADIGGGYLRIQDLSKPFRAYFDLKGESVNNYIDEKGKQHGRPKAEREALTHFRIKYRSEM